MWTRRSLPNIDLIDERLEIIGTDLQSVRVAQDCLQNQSYGATSISPGLNTGSI